MAKVAFSKLNTIKKLPPIVYTFGENQIEVEQYLPLEEKVELIGNVIALAGSGEEGFFNIVKLEAFYCIEMLKNYTNITFTDKQLEDITKVYDGIKLNDIWAFVEDKIPQTEREYIWDNILNLAREITNYNHSALGILRAITDDRNNLNFDIEELMNKIKDPEALTLLKELTNKTGLT